MSCLHFCLTAALSQKFPRVRKDLVTRLRLAGDRAWPQRLEVEVRERRAIDLHWQPAFGMLIRFGGPAQGLSLRLVEMKHELEKKLKERNKRCAQLWDDSSLLRHRPVFLVG